MVPADRLLAVALVLEVVFLAATALVRLVPVDRLLAVALVLEVVFLAATALVRLVPVDRPLAVTLVLEVVFLPVAELVCRRLVGDADRLEAEILARPGDEAPVRLAVRVERLLLLRLWFDLLGMVVS